MTDWDDAFANAAYIPDGVQYPELWAAAAAEYRGVEQALGRAMLNLGYGDAPRERYDLFFPAGPPEGLAVFLHGGYWMEFDKGYWSHLAAGPTARGWAVAIPSYTLAPEARIAEIPRQVARAVTAAARRIAGPIAIAGHSAGGHLAVRLVSDDLALPYRERVVRALPISPLADLRPLRRTAMNAVPGLAEAEAATESLVLHPAPSVPVHVWVGAEERPAFLDQARRLAGAWGAPLTRAPGRHHFDVIADLTDPGSALTAGLIGS